MFDKKDRRRKLEEQFLYLDAGKDLDEIQRFVPDMQMLLLAEAPGDQDLFPLSLV